MVELDREGFVEGEEEEMDTVSTAEEVIVDLIVGTVS